MDGKHPWQAPGDGAALRIDGERLAAADGRSWPLRGGIPRFVDDDFAESFGYQWNRFEVRRPQEDEDTFVVKTGVPLSALRGLRVLDAGCGGGRYTRVASDHGAEVVAIDRSRAADKCLELAEGRPGVAIAQADLTALPLAPASFDFAFSIGVMHHAPDCRAAFDAVAKMVRPGGRLSVWLYRRNTPPQEWINNATRWLARRLPRGALLAACRLGAWIGGVPILGQAFSKIVNVSTHPDPALRFCDTFDWYSPTHQSHHTPGELAEWFAAAGFVEIHELPPAKRGRIYRGAVRLGLVPGSGVNFTGRRR
jgi:SAM-dependent methyltransferase